MTTFHHGGRFGDLVFALQTIKRLGGGHLWLSGFHTPGWSARHAETMLSFLEYQDYITEATVAYLPEDILQQWRTTQRAPRSMEVDFDLWEAERDTPMSAVPYNGVPHLGHRYAHHFNVGWDINMPWIKAPATKDVDVVFHSPRRRMTRLSGQWVLIVNMLSNYGDVTVVDYEGEWDCFSSDVEVIKPTDFLDFADYINSAKVFIGSVSSGNAIAEALCKHRIVDVADGCFDTHQDGGKSIQSNQWSDTKIVDKVRTWLMRH